MNELVRKLLTDKLVDDFYEEDVQGNVGPSEDELTEQLKGLSSAVKRRLCSPVIRA